ncbi:hypothetical protein ABE50_23130 [Bacillus wiedmannii]|nr:hypothetical protein [Bacillus wiedmannii]
MLFHERTNLYVTSSCKINPEFGTLLRESSDIKRHHAFSKQHNGYKKDPLMESEVYENVALIRERLFVYIMVLFCYRKNLKGVT